MKMNTQEKQTPDYQINMELILCKEPIFGEAVVELIQHLANTYNDKYDSKESCIDTKVDLYSKNGKFISVYQCKRYLQRYNTSGFNKSEMIIDLKKAIHYLLFEITRKLMNEEESKSEITNS